MAMRARRTLSLTKAPIFKSIKRIVPTVALASSFVPPRAIYTVFASGPLQESAKYLCQRHLYGSRPDISILL